MTHLIFGRQNRAAATLMKGALVGSVVAASAGTAHAVPVIFTNQIAWTAAIGAASVIVEDFETSPVGVLPYATTDIGAFSVTLDGTGVQAVNRVTSSGPVNGSHGYNGFVGGPTTQLDFGGFGDLIGFAGDWANTADRDILTVTVNGFTFDFDDALPDGNGFLGIVDLEGFSVLAFGTNDVTGLGEGFALDNALLASGAIAVPEPGTLALLGLGLAGIGFQLRRPRAA